MKEGPMGVISVPVIAIAFATYFMLSFLVSFIVLILYFLDMTDLKHAESH